VEQNLGGGGGRRGRPVAVGRARPGAAIRTAGGHTTTFLDWNLTFRF
jgi:hypothetical protein